MAIQRVILGSVTEKVDYGLTASATERNTGVKFLRITDIQDDTVDWGKVPYCVCTPEEAQQHWLEEGDIVFARTGATTGKSYLIHEFPEGAVFASYLIRVRPRKDVLDPVFLSYYFRTSDYWQQVSGSAVGAAQLGFNATKLKGLVVPLPPLPKQKRIAAILAKADRLRRLRRTARDLSDTYLQSVFLEMFGDPVTNPMGWRVTKLKSQIRHIDSGWSPVCGETRTSDEQWAVLRLGAVTSGIYLPDENKQLLPGSEPRPDLEVKKGDVLITRKNTVDLVAACAFVHHTPTKLMLPDTIFRFVFRGDSQVRSEYLWGLFSEKTFRKKVQSLATGTAGSMPNISKEKLLGVEILLPPVSLQQEFARIVHQFERLRAQQREAERQAEHLFQTLLHRAFRGEL